MAIVTYKPDPNNPYRPSKEELARLDALTDEQITAAALSDPDNPPLTEEEFQRVEAMDWARNARKKLGLTQEAFAEQFHITLGRLRDLEQGRHQPDSAFLAYLKLIARDPEHVLKTLAS